MTCIFIYFKNYVFLQLIGLFISDLESILIENLILLCLFATTSRLFQLKAYYFLSSFIHVIPMKTWWDKTTGFARGSQKEEDAPLL